MTSTAHEILPPPVERYSLLGWLKKNLFQNWFSTLATIFMLAAGFVVVRGVVQWVVFDADWGVVTTNLQLLLIGQYPRDQVWRLWIILALMGAIAGLSWGVWVRYHNRGATLLVVGMPFLLALLPYDALTRLLWLTVGLVTLGGYLLGSRYPNQLRRLASVGWLAFLPMSLVLIRGIGDDTILPTVATNIWGGLLLTLVIAGIGLVVSFPIGVAPGGRPPLPLSGDSGLLHRLHRADPLGAADHGALHGPDHDPPLPAGHDQHRPGHARHHRIHPVQRSLHGGERAGRLAGGPQGPV